MKQNKPKKHKNEDTAEIPQKWAGVQAAGGRAGEREGGCWGVFRKDDAAGESVTEIWM